MNHHQMECDAEGIEYLSAIIECARFSYVLNTFEYMVSCCLLNCFWISIFNPLQ